jgi:creatinine amidohydrolase
LQTAVSDFRAEQDVSVALVSYWDLIEDEIASVRESDVGGVSHGGEMETSIQLYLREKLVDDRDRDFVRDDREGYARTDLFGSGAVYYPGHFDKKTETGISGAPSSASAEKGERLFERSVEAVSAFLCEYNTW